MSETLTVDPTPEAEVAAEVEGVSLTAEEQDSLQVGEQIQEQQEQLFAGKYKSAEELEKAYGELQKKLGEKGDEDSEEAGDSEPTESEESSEETEEAIDYSKGYLEDGKVNYEQVNESYGEQLGNVLKNANLDPWAISKHFHENKGTITDEMQSSLESAGFSKQAISAYLAGRAVESGYIESAETADISTAVVNEVKETAGGETAYNNMVQWAGENLSQSSIDAFDNIINSGSVDAIKLAVSGLKAQYENSNGYEGKMLTGKAPTNTKDVYRSQAELVAAMSDSRYDNDPAYRQDVIAKLDRSDNLEF